MTFWCYRINNQDDNYDMHEFTVIKIIIAQNMNGKAYILLTRHQKDKFKERHP
jgi:hypothetical protein